MRRAVTSKTLRITAATLALLVSCIGIVACGEKSESTKGQPKTDRLDLMLDWYPNPDHAPIYDAIESDFYKQVGIDVQPQVPSDPAAPIKQVAAGRVDLAISYEPEVFLARQQGLPVVAVAALIQRPLTSLMSTAKGGVKSARGLRGKRVGTAGIPYQSAYLDTVLEQAGVPKSSVKETNVGANLLPAMLSRKVDATLGGFWNVEGIQLKQRKTRPTIIPVDKLGVPDYDELVLVANSDSLSDKRNDLRLFISATARGADRVRKNPREAIDALHKANDDLDRKLLEASVRATIPAFFPSKQDVPWGFLDPVQWRNYGGWMKQQGLVEDLPDVDAATTNDLLPGEGL